MERARGPVQPVKRPRGPQAITFFFTFLQPATLGFLYAIPEKPMQAATRKHPPTPPLKAESPSIPPPQHQLDNVFIDALVQASLCRYHARRYTVQPLTPLSTYTYHKMRRKHHDTMRQMRHIHRKATTPRNGPLSREECLSMVETYREPFSTQAMCAQDEPFRPAHDLKKSWAQGPAPKRAESLADIPADQTFRSIPMSSEKPQLSEPSHPMGHLKSPQVSPEPDSVQDGHGELPIVEELLRTLEDENCTHEAAFEAYSALPFPGVALLPHSSIRLLFRRLSVVEIKNKDSMLRYLSVVDEMKSAGLPMTEAEWNSAILFCGKCFTIIRQDNVKDALQIWKEMEHGANVKSGNVTFNILFDIAAKAGKFVLAEMILKEMEDRKLSVNRYARVGRIYYHGLRRDGESVRRAYRELVEEGEIVDTVVMNCLIASLIRAEEPAAAEQVYERMKHVLQNHTGLRDLPTYSWKHTRDLGRALDRAARMFKYHPLKLEQIQNEQLLAPDIHTYSIFIEHHASRTGELSRIGALLTEMKHFGVPMHGRIFLKIFKGFAFHGGIRHTFWTKTRLESVWKSLLDALDEENEVRIMKWMVIWTVRAFARCAGRERGLEVWGELRRRWEPGGREMEDVMGVLRDVLKVEQV